MVKTPAQIITEVNAIYVANEVGSIDAGDLKGTYTDITELEAQTILDLASADVAATRTVVLSVGLNDPPGSAPPANTAFVLGSAPIFVWAGHGKEIAIWTGALYLFRVPVEGTRVYNQTDNVEWQFDGLNWGVVSSSGVTDHGALTGLGDDDHTQYHNDARGDARYPQTSLAGAFGLTMLDADTTAIGTALLNLATGDFGAGGVKGLVPAPAIGDATKFLRGDMTYVTATGDVPSSRQIISGNGLTGGGDLSVDRTLHVGAGTGVLANSNDVAVDKASDSQVRAATANKVLTADHIETASALVTLTDGVNIAVDWDAAINWALTLGGNRTLDNPTNGQPGTWRTIEITQDGTGGRTLVYGNQYQFGNGIEPVLSTAIAAVDFLTIFCRSTTKFYVFSSLDMKV